MFAIKNNSKKIDILNLYDIKYNRILK
jgi:hypothetical protein